MSALDSTCICIIDHLCRSYVRRVQNLYKNLGILPLLLLATHGAIWRSLSYCSEPELLQLKNYCDEWEETLLQTAHAVCPDWRKLVKSFDTASAILLPKQPLPQSTKGVQVNDHGIFEGIPFIEGNGLNSNEIAINLRDVESAANGHKEFICSRCSKKQTIFADIQDRTERDCSCYHPFITSLHQYSPIVMFDTKSIGMGVRAIKVNRSPSVRDEAS